MNIQKLLKAKKVIANFAEEKISPKLGYKFLKFCKAIDAEEEFFNERMNELVETYCKKNDDGSYVRTNDGGLCIYDDKIEECNKAVKELNALEVDKPTFIFTIAELEELKLSVADLMCLDDFIEEG